MDADTFGRLMRETLAATGRAKSLATRYSMDGDMRTVGGETRDDKGPLEIANGEEERLVRELWTAFYDVVAPAISNAHKGE